jgi:hypothetical protein
MQYRKKPLIVEAFQMTKDRRWNNSDWPDWLHLAWNKPMGAGALWCDPKPDYEDLFLGTLEGVFHICWEDWIVQGVKGELYPCKPDIFEMTYEPIDDAPC